jgi:acyl-CoA synthetase (NDP forming)
MAKAAGLQLCGGNGMGFYNLEYGLRVCGFPPPSWLEHGPLALIAHSGSTFAALVHGDKRFRYSLAVSPGQELVTTVADYLDYALEMESTRVVGLFLETVRDPQAFIAALEKSRDRDIPVIAVKVGRTAESAVLAQSHSGALAGNDAAYQAVFDRYGVIQVDDLDQLANAMLLFGQKRRLARGGLATIHDSGGLRELTVDLAAARQVPFAKIDATTTQKLAARLDYGLEPVNPLDAWGTGQDYQGIFTDCFTALVQDPNTALGVFFVETRSGHYLHEGYAEVVRQTAASTNKPVMIAHNMASITDDELALRISHAGIPVLIGIAPTMAAIRGAMDYRDFRELPAIAPAAPPAGARQRWTPRLQQAAPLDEAESLALFADYGLPVLPHRIAESSAAALAAARELGFPVALKTAMPGIPHKSDVGGVRLALGDAAALGAAYDDVAKRLGPRVLVMPMAGKGVELAFGAVDDPQFGPIVMAGAGGVLIEVLKDRRFALPPFDAPTARQLVDRLRLRPLLDGVRGQPAADMTAAAETLARFSVMVADLQGLVQEIDVNPLICGPRGCVALDALVVPRTARS